VDHLVERGSGCPWFSKLLGRADFFSNQRDVSLFRDTADIAGGGASPLAERQPRIGLQRLSVLDFDLERI
jgi:hypothetical protein